MSLVGYHMHAEWYAASSNETESNQSETPALLARKTEPNCLPSDTTGLDKSLATEPFPLTVNSRYPFVLLPEERSTGFHSDDEIYF